jgi:hypothetical protein
LAFLATSVIRSISRWEQTPPEDLPLEVDAGLLERRRELVAGQLPHVLVRDEQWLAAELADVLADGGEHATALDVAAGGDERLGRTRFCHSPSPSDSCGPG